MFSRKDCIVLQKEIIIRLKYLFYFLRVLFRINVLKLFKVFKKYILLYCSVVFRSAIINFEVNKKSNEIKMKDKIQFKNIL